MSEIKFIHAADLHLDSPMIGLRNLPKRIFSRIQESTFTSLKNIIDLAISNKVDFVILAGDLYDADDRSIRAQIRLRREMERLDENGISAFIIHGNHDFLSDSWAQIEMPDNVHTFSQQVEYKTFISKTNSVVHLYGFSYPTRHVLDRRIDKYKKTEGADFHIGILHGNLEGTTDHGNYAPFQLKDLLNKQYDYWALGHIHKRQILLQDPPIIYPGNIQGRNRKETDEKGCYLVSLNGSSSKLEFMDTADVLWKEVMVDASSAQSFHEVFELCRNALESLRYDGKGVIVQLLIQNLSLNDQYSFITLKSDLLEALMESEHEEDSFVWTYEIKLQDSIEWNRELLASESDFYGELFQIIDNFKGIEDSTSVLYSHPVARKFLTSLSQEEKDLLLKESEELLIRQLLFEK